MNLIVLTGGPGAGKTAVLELAKKLLGDQVAILPEAASIIFGGGFWRLQTPTARMAAQRAIYYVQNEMENLVASENRWPVGLCDRGTIDGLAYWPGDPSLFWQDLKTSSEKEYARYRGIIHLRTPSSEHGYNHQNPIRIETAAEAAVIDARISEIWKSHPRYFEIPSTIDFIDKAKAALDLIFSQLLIERSLSTATSESIEGVSA